MTFATGLARTAGFTTRYLLAVVAMLLVALAQVPALIWYVTAASPACDHSRSLAAVHLAQVGILTVGAASAGFAVLLGARFLRLVWGWAIWWIVPVAALAAPVAVLVLFNRVVPATGGLLCH